MLVVEIYAGDLFIGDVVLADVDDGMGVAFGPFRASPGYPTVRPQVTAAAEARQRGEAPASIGLEARTKSGERIETSFVTIDDFWDVSVDPEAAVQFENRDQFWRLLRSAV